MRTARRRCSRHARCGGVPTYQGNNRINPAAKTLVGAVGGGLATEVKCDTCRTKLLREASFDATLRAPTHVVGTEGTSKYRAQGLQPQADRNNELRKKGTCACGRDSIPPSGHLGIPRADLLGGGELPLCSASLGSFADTKAQGNIPVVTIDLRLWFPWTGTSVEYMGE